MTFLTTCTCCGTELTKPQFFKGKAYGMSCIKNVNPVHKVNKKANWIKVSYEACTNGGVLKLTNREGKSIFHPKREVENILSSYECFVPSFYFK